MIQLRMLPSLWEEFFREPWPRWWGGAERTARPLLERPGARWTPPVEVLDGPDSVVVVVEIPGVSPEDVEVVLDGEVLTVKGEKRLPRRSEGEAWLQLECAYGPFERSFALGMPVRAEQVRANYRDGVLRIRIPKSRGEPAKVRVKVE